jgi:hypothetical protein
MKSIVFLPYALLMSFTQSFGQNIPMPLNYTIVDSIKGDLNGDGTEELIIAYNTQMQPEDNFESIQRELVI